MFAASTIMTLTLPKVQSLDSYYTATHACMRKLFASIHSNTCRHYFKVTEEATGEGWIEKLHREASHVQNLPHRNARYT